MNDSAAFSLKRFLVRVVPCAIGAGILWKLTLDQNAAFTIWLTKALHSLCGRPAPYLYCDETRLFWHATMFPPVVALTLGSYWIGWLGRVERALAGYVAHCGMTAIAIAINESPYVQQLSLLNPVTSTLVNANYLMLGVVIWVLAAGPWYGTARHGGTEARRHEGMEKRVARKWGSIIAGLSLGWATRVCLLWVAVGLVVPVFGMMGSKAGMAARGQVAAAMRAIPFFPQPSWSDVTVAADQQYERDRATAQALKEIRAAIETDEADGLESGALWYLTAHLFGSLRPQDDQLAAQFKAQAAMAMIKAKDVRAK